MLSFGFFVPYQVVGPPESIGVDELYKQMLEQAVLADQYGFDRIWVPEHHLTHYLQAPSAFMTAIQVGLHVKCRVGTMVSILPYHHPLRVAGEIAVADQILGGRFEAGVGRGGYAYEFRHLGANFGESGQIFQESLQALTEILRAEQAASFHGKYVDFKDAAVWPKPLQNPHPPVWVAGRSTSTIELAARLGCSLATWPVMGPDSIIKGAIDTFRRATEASALKESQEFGVLRLAYVADEESELRSVTETIMQNHRIGRRLHHDWTTTIDANGYVAPERVRDEPTFETMRRNLVFGTTAECVTKLRSYEEMGVDHVMFQLSFGLRHEQTCRQIRKFGEQVLAVYRADAEERMQ